MVNCLSLGVDFTSPSHTDEIPTCDVFDHPKIDQNEPENAEEYLHSAGQNKMKEHIAILPIRNQENWDWISDSKNDTYQNTAKILNTKWKNEAPILAGL